MRGGWCTLRKVLMCSALSLMTMSRGSLMVFSRNAQKLLLVSKQRRVASFRASASMDLVKMPVPAPYSVRYFELGVILPISFGFLMKFLRKMRRSFARDRFSMGDGAYGCLKRFLWRLGRKSRSRSGQHRLALRFSNCNRHSP